MTPGLSNGYVTGDPDPVTQYPDRSRSWVSIYFDANILKTVEDRGSVPVGHNRK